ncbi:hypothetical protein U0070_016121 [Myodes glareolus]|uniref:Uncharacterized protein n=1 Tax=Myodes glareolus TaxID=447135 RepID=A0AAW0IEN1_MYOGA
MAESLTRTDSADGNNDLPHEQDGFSRPMTVEAINSRLIRFENQNFRLHWRLVLQSRSSEDQHRQFQVYSVQGHLRRILNHTLEEEKQLSHVTAQTFHEMTDVRNTKHDVLRGERQHRHIRKTVNGKDGSKPRASINCSSVVKGPILKTESCQISIIHGNSTITKRSPRESPASLVWQKPEASNQTNDSAVNTCKKTRSGLHSLRGDQTHLKEAPVTTASGCCGFHQKTEQLLPGPLCYNCSRQRGSHTEEGKMNGKREETGKQKQAKEKKREEKRREEKRREEKRREEKRREEKKRSPRDADIKGSTQKEKQEKKQAHDGREVWAAEKRKIILRLQHSIELSATKVRKSVHSEPHQEPLTQEMLTTPNPAFSAGIKTNTGVSPAEVKKAEQLRKGSCLLTGRTNKVRLFSLSGAKSFIVTFGSIHCIQRLTRPLDPPMVLVVCSKVTESENGDSSPACTESPCGSRNPRKTLTAPQTLHSSKEYNTEQNRTELTRAPQEPSQICQLPRYNIAKPAETKMLVATTGDLALLALETLTLGELTPPLSNGTGKLTKMTWAGRADSRLAGGGGVSQQRPRLTNLANPQVHPNIHGICDLLEKVKELVLYYAQAKESPSSHVHRSSSRECHGTLSIQQSLNSWMQFYPNYSGLRNLHLAMDGDRDRDPHRNTGLDSLGPNEK